MVGSPNYIKTPLFRKKVFRRQNKSSQQGAGSPHSRGRNQGGGGRGRGRNQGGGAAGGFQQNRRSRKNPKALSDDEWNNLRGFNETQIEKNIDGIAKEMTLMIQHFGFYLHK